MLIPLGESYLVETDKYNWTLKTRRKASDADDEASNDDKADGADGWRVVGYYASAADALTAALRHGVMTSDAVGFESVVRAIEQAEKRITSSLDAMYERKREQMSLFN